MRKLAVIGFLLSGCASQKNLLLDTQQKLALTEQKLIVTINKLRNFEQEHKVLYKQINTLRYQLLTTKTERDQFKEVVVEQQMEAIEAVQPKTIIVCSQDDTDNNESCIILHLNEGIKNE